MEKFPNNHVTIDVNSLLIKVHCVFKKNTGEQITFKTLYQSLRQWHAHAKVAFAAQFAPRAAKNGRDTAAQWPVKRRQKRDSCLIL